MTPVNTYLWVIAKLASEQFQSADVSCIRLDLEPQGNVLAALEFHHPVE
jgi:hypothetical protein